MRGALEPGAPAPATGHSPRILFLTAFAVDFLRFAGHFCCPVWVLGRDSFWGRVWCGLRTNLVKILVFFFSHRTPNFPFGFFFSHPVCTKILSGGQRRERICFVAPQNANDLVVFFLFHVKQAAQWHNGYIDMARPGDEGKTTALSTWRQ